MSKLNRSIRISNLLLLILLMVVHGLPTFASEEIQETNSEILVINKEGQPTQNITDGDTIQIRVVLAFRTEANTAIEFYLDENHVSGCTISPGESQCTSTPVQSLGWSWYKDRAIAVERVISALKDGILISSQKIQMKPRPVVMVHGFTSSWEAWKNYLGPQGFLAKVGIAGFAVGDGQVEGVMNTGSLDNPAGTTHTIRQNAEILGEYIARVKAQTGAEMVDLLAHSMGGLISRYYIDSFMSNRDIAQLIMLGSPMAGTDCANLPATLGLYLPATLEIRPSYVVGIFNQQVTHRRGVSFYALAGDPIREAFKSPCTSIPTDLAVSLDSVTAIPLEARHMSILHTDLNALEIVFKEFVLPLLQKPVGAFSESPDLPAEQSNQTALQFTRVYTGRLMPGESHEVTIQIEEGVIVASFALFDTSRTLSVTVRGASGNEIVLTSEQNGLVILDDPSALFYLGYGFNNPRPGSWRVTLSAADHTPASGADYAITAYMIGGAVLDAAIEPLLPKVNEPIELVATLRLENEPQDISTAQVLVRRPDGQLVELDLTPDGNQVKTIWLPESPGHYTLDLRVTSRLTDGTDIERTAFLSFEAQPENTPTNTTLGMIFVILLSLVLFTAVAAFFSVTWLVRKKRMRKDP